MNPFESAPVPGMRVLDAADIDEVSGGILPALLGLAGVLVGAGIYLATEYLT